MHNTHGDTHPTTQSPRRGDPGPLAAALHDLQHIFGDRLQAFVAYGDANAIPAPSLALVQTISADDLNRCAARVLSWHRAGCATPLMLTRDEFAGSLDAFPIEYGEILDTHRVLFGADPFAGLAIRDEDLRRACEVQVKSHLVHLRELQDQTGGFTAFACWTMQPEGVPEKHIYPPKATPAVYLRVQALARIFLDNFDNIQTSYVTQGLKMAQVTLRYGCNDFGGTMLEENVVSAAGCFNLQSIQQIERVIERAGFTPLQRNSWYGIVDGRFDAPPDDPRRDVGGVDRALREFLAPVSTKNGGGRPIRGSGSHAIWLVEDSGPRRLRSQS